MGYVFQCKNFTPRGYGMKKEAMSKIQKAVAKLYFALGESETQTPINAEITEAAAEYMAFLAIRNTGEALGLRYFAMGAASAHRKAAKPPRGKSSRTQLSGKLSPTGGKKPVKQAKPGKIKSKEPGYWEKYKKGLKEMEEDLDLDEVFEDDSENDWEE
jgi:hypothetical protein